MDKSKIACIRYIYLQQQILNYCVKTLINIMGVCYILIKMKMEWKDNKALLEMVWLLKDNVHASKKIIWIQEKSVESIVGLLQDNDKHTKDILNLRNVIILFLIVLFVSFIWFFIQSFYMSSEYNNKIIEERVKYLNRFNEIQKENIELRLRIENLEK